MKLDPLEINFFTLLASKSNLLLAKLKDIRGNSKSKNLRSDIRQVSYLTIQYVFWKILSHERNIYIHCNPSLNCELCKSIVSCRRNL